MTDIGRSLKRNQPIVVIDAKTGKRQLIWSELNMVAKNPRKRTLDIHPGIGWREGHRYIVALRNLKRSNGSTIKAPRAFRIYRDGLPGGSRAVDRRDPHMQDIFNTARPRRDQPGRAVPRLGLHDLEPPGADEAAAVDPRPLLRRARRPQPA